MQGCGDTWQQGPGACGSADSPKTASGSLSRLVCLVLIDNTGVHQPAGRADPAAPVRRRAQNDATEQQRLGLGPGDTERHLGRRSQEPGVPRRGRTECPFGACRARPRAAQNDASAGSRPERRTGDMCCRSHERRQGSSAQRPQESTLPRSFSNLTVRGRPDRVSRGDRRARCLVPDTDCWLRRASLRLRAVGFKPKEQRSAAASKDQCSI
jgi:hypothetical protein